MVLSGRGCHPFRGCGGRRGVPCAVMTGVDEGGAFRAQPGWADGEVWRHAPLSCLACGYRIDATGAADGGVSRAPGDGDLVVCFRCGEVMAYAVGVFGVAVRELTGAELAEFSRSGHARHVRRIHEFWLSQQGGGPAGGAGGVG